MNRKLKEIHVKESIYYLILNIKRILSHGSSQLPSHQIRPQSSLIPCHQTSPQKLFGFYLLNFSD
jgi:hypothetical protein